jgi:potassium channel subfamily K, other eukaryote
MARRLSFSIAQPITILGFWIASVLLISLIAVADNDFHASGVRRQALTQAYYYAIFAAILYQIISYLMCVTVYGAFKGHYSKEFKLTAAQRTLMLQTISFLVYQHIWALGYSHIEGWKFLDAVYWADFTSLTIGIGGSYVPKTHLGRSLLFPFALGGIVILGLVVGSIRSLVLDRGKKKMAARMTEKTRRRVVARIEKNIERDRLRVPRTKKISEEMVRALTLKPGDDTISEQDRRKYEFDAMRLIQDRAATRRQYVGLAISATAFAILVSLFLLTKRKVLTPLVVRRSLRLLQDREKPEMDLLRVLVLRIHHAFDDWIWRFRTDEQQWQTILRLLVTSCDTHSHHSHL